MLKRKTRSLRSRRALLEALEPRQLLTSIVATFTNGNGSVSADQYIGAAGSGWSTAWTTQTSNGSYAGGVTTSNPLNFNGANLNGTFTATAANGTAAVSRGYTNSGTVTIGGTQLITFDYRFNGSLGTFTTSSDFVGIQGDNAARAGTHPNNTWTVGARGVTSGGIPARNWSFQSGPGGAFDSEIALATDHTYRFTINADPANHRFQGKVKDLTTGAQSPFSDWLDFRNTAATTTSFINFSSLRDQGSETSQISFDTLTITNPPSVPTNPSGLTATPMSSSRIDFIWSNPTGETGYVMERATNAAFTGTVEKTDLPADVTSFSATGLSGGTTYYFRLRAVNDGGASGYSGVVTTTTNAPSHVHATPVSSSKIDVTWQDHSGVETGFEIDRATNAAFTSNFTTFNVGANVTSYGDSGLGASQTYYYRVRSVNGGVDSNNSNTATASKITYLSDLTWTSATNGWGPVEKDKSNGEAGAGDGTTISLADVQYSKGLGVHSTSEITYNIAGAYSQFLSDIGVDDEAGGIESDNGNVTFEVWLDGVKSYDSGVMTGKDGTKSISLNVSGKNTLKLVVTDGDGTDATSDHADWANARLKAPGGAPILPTGIEVTPVSSSQINVRWNDNTDDESGFEVDYTTVAGFGSGITTVNVGPNEYSKAITGLSAGTTYYFRVRSTNALSDSANTGVAVASTLLSSAPTALSVTSMSTTAVGLTWTGSASRYNVERSSDGVNFSSVGMPTTTTFTDTIAGGDANKVLYYRVRNQTGALISTISNVAVAATFAATDVYNVTAYGAQTADNAFNDFDAVTDAIAASGPGDVIYFPNGTYNFTAFLDEEDNDIPNGIQLGGDRILLGQNGAILKGSGTNGQLISLNGDNVTFAGLTLNGGGIFMDRPSGMNQNIVFDSNVFQVDVSSGKSNRRGVYFTSGLQNSRISNNYFTGYNSEFAIFGLAADHLTIANNEFVNIDGGIHIDLQNATADTFIVEQNYLSGIRGYGFEFQDNGTNIVIQDNYFESPDIVSPDGSAAFSVPLDSSTGAIIRRNTAIGAGAETVWGWEIGGTNTIVEDNYSSNVWHVVSNTDDDGGTSTTVRNNRFTNFGKSPSISFSGTLIEQNNASDVELTWDINRAKPKRWQRY